ncbi:hypothetical protein KD050_08825 [Psychrobacillus sp. INOP01]|uniref:hypothetical protein n=1 Tax=Psychrobacillus sp. INOP01 TaxID=2829187 RepID=UPI001BA9F604|nr:hypothetical protein [Psychrobacillus sp. INOP01]QUG43305.1 hypothetical protein KD050_08825 [Psychrobacillus sp. INOP01]
MQRKIRGVFTATAVFLFSVIVGTKKTLAGPASIKDAFEKVGIKEIGVLSGFDEVLNVIFIAFIAAGAFWSIIWLAIAKIKLSAVNGNIQKRNQGIGALFMVLCGLYLIYKLFDIVSFPTGK